MIRARLFSCLAVLLAMLCALPAHAANNIAAELVVEGPARPGSTVEVALHFRPGPGWHGYWLNPGDAGYGMTLDWTLPDGWKAGQPRYPVPQTLVIGGLMNHVYEDDYAVLIPVTVPATAALDDLGPVTVKARWLACTDKICVPEGAELSARVTMGQSTPSERFDAWRAAIPAMIDSPATFALADGKLRVAIPLPETLAVPDPHLFLVQDGVIDYAAPQIFTRKGDRLIATIAAADGASADSLEGILRLQGRDGVRFTARVGAVPAGGVPIGRGAGPPSAMSLGPLWLLIAGAIAGGLLLNVMPCVFPILSLKALSLARAGESEAQARAEGLAYTAGVVLAVLGLGAVLLVLRAGGEQIGWAFQLQEPGVVVALLLLAVAITANLAGLFELPSISITRPGHASGAFATGLLAAVAATPCTGPFMAAAMGAALLLPVSEALALFAALGLGLALPFLLLGFVPPLRALLPKPGAWMERFRHLMAIPMGLTALALIWLASRLGGKGFALVALIVAAGLMIALMICGRQQRKGRSGWPPFALVIAPFAVFAAFALPGSLTTPSDEAEGADSILAPQPFSQSAL
ncbi:MAG: thiol:disulfide interchange protein, partial [Novosphingobium sp.]|nr:thiol:disulfide interchange protein [Novosphingobium sp.]